LLSLINHSLSRLEQMSRLIDSPSNDQLQSATSELLALNAIHLEQIGDHLNVHITEEGQSLVLFPVEPILAKYFLYKNFLIIIYFENTFGCFKA